MKGKKLRELIAIIVATIILVGIAVFTLTARGNTTIKKVEELLDLGNKYLIEQDYEQAIATFQKVIEIDPKCEEAYMRLADAYIGLGDYETACDVIKKGVEQTGSDRLEIYLEEISQTYTGIQQNTVVEAEKEKQTDIVAKLKEEDDEKAGEKESVGEEEKEEGTADEDAADNMDSNQDEDSEAPDQGENIDQNDGNQDETEMTPVMKVIDEAGLRDEARSVLDNTGSMSAAEEIFDNALAAQSGNKRACDQIELARMWFYQQLYNGHHEQIVSVGNKISPDNLEYGQRILYYEIMKLSCYELGDIDKYNEYDWLGYQLCVQGSD